MSWVERAVLAYTILTNYSYLFGMAVVAGVISGYRRRRKAAAIKTWSWYGGRSGDLGQGILLVFAVLLSAAGWAWIGGW